MGLSLLLGHPLRGARRVHRLELGIRNIGLVSCNMLFLMRSVNLRKRGEIARRRSLR